MKGKLRCSLVLLLILVGVLCFVYPETELRQTSSVPNVILPGDISGVRPWTTTEASPKIQPIIFPEEDR